MTDTNEETNPKHSSIRKWIRYGFLIWAVVSTSYLINTMRTQGVDPAVLQNSPAVTVNDRDETLEFLPVQPEAKAGLIFICGSGVVAKAYVPMLRPIAEEGHAVFIIKLPYRFAPFESHKREAIARVHRVIAQHSEIAAWVLSGHSLGGALACRAIGDDPNLVSALVLIGTTHPKRQDLSGLTIPVTKVYGTNDGIAPIDKVMANKHLLPEHTKWVEIKGGNHSQFGHYGHQFLDGYADISREEQQDITRKALLDAIAQAGATIKTGTKANTP